MAAIPLAPNLNSLACATTAAFQGSGFTQLGAPAWQQGHAPGCDLNPARRQPSCQGVCVASSFADMQTVNTKKQKPGVSLRHMHVAPMHVPAQGPATAAHVVLVRLGGGRGRDGGRGLHKKIQRIGALPFTFCMCATELAARMAAERQWRRRVRSTSAISAHRGGFGWGGGRGPGGLGRGGGRGLQNIAASWQQSDSARGSIASNAGPQHRRTGVVAWGGVAAAALEGEAWEEGAGEADVVWEAECCLRHQPPAGVDVVAASRANAERA